MKDKIKQERGFTGVDILIAVLIIALFTGLISSISYNIYLSNSSIKRMSKARDYIVDMFEHIDKTYYDDITKEKLVKYFNDKYYYKDDGSTPKSDAEVKMQEEQEEITTPFKAEINIVKFNEIEGNEDKLDLVQEITMKVTYTLGNKEQKIEMKKIKSRENFKTPNSPDFRLLEVQEGYKVYPLKRVNNKWKVCNQDDTGWYNYETGNWILAIKTTRDLKTGDQIDGNNLPSGDEIYAWIPRYAYDNTNKKIIFLFSNSNNYVENVKGYNTLEPIDTDTYTVPTDFSNSIGKWAKEFNNGIYENLNQVYPLKK